jgi:phage baseplate assembly protein W
MAKYIDIDLNFEPHPNTGDVTRLFDVDAIKSSMRNILLTDIGTKPFDRYFGLGLQSILFEDMTPGTMIAIERLIFEKLTEYEPRVVVDSVQLDLSDEDINALSIDIFFYMVGNEEKQQLNFVIERVR